MVDTTLSLLIVFFLPPLLTSFHYKNEGIDFWKAYVTSLIATCLLPIFLLSTKSTLLDGLSTNSDITLYDFIHLFSYSILCSLAGTTLINKMLGSFGLLKENRELKRKNSKLVNNVVSSINREIEHKKDNSFRENVVDSMKLFLAKRNVFVKQNEFPKVLGNDILKFLLEEGLIEENSKHSIEKAFRITETGVAYCSKLQRTPSD